MKIDKDKLPKGLTYPLKSSLFSELLEAAGIRANVHLIFSMNHESFEASYWLPNENVKYDRFYIRTGPVESEESIKAREYMESNAIPEFIKWASYLFSLPSNSRKL